MGYYKFPYNCDHTTIGRCKYVIMWFKTDAPEEVRFAIVAKDVDQTEIGFSITKDIVRVLYLENNSVFFLIP